jgi:hypothetical protein
VKPSTPEVELLRLLSSDALKSRRFFAGPVSINSEMFLYERIMRGTSGNISLSRRLSILDETESWCQVVFRSFPFMVTDFPEYGGSLSELESSPMRDPLLADRLSLGLFFASLNIYSERRPFRERCLMT